MFHVEQLGVIMEFDTRAFITAITSIVSANKRQGIGSDFSLVSNCPFHKEKTPSFTIKNDMYYCFSCGNGGEVRDLGRDIYENAKDMGEEI